MASTRTLNILNQFTNEGRTGFTATEVADVLGTSPQATSNLLARWTRLGLVDRVTSGRYAIRQLGKLGSTAVWDDLGSAVAAAFAGKPHRIGYLTALDHHGLLVRPVRSVQVASPYRPRGKTLNQRPLRVIHESEETVLIGTETLGPSRIATVPRALLDVASRPQLVGGASRLTEALVASGDLGGLSEIATLIGAEPAYRRIGSLATTLSLPVRDGLEAPSWVSLIELDRNAQRNDGWIDKEWGVAWPYSASELQGIVSA